MRALLSAAFVILIGATALTIARPGDATSTVASR
jgi:hypothetical protein